MMSRCRTAGLPCLPLVADVTTRRETLGSTRLELYVGQGSAIYVVIAAVVLLILTRVRRRR
jgi:hypothetical protein